MDISEIREWAIEKRELLIIIAAGVIVVVCVIVGISLRSGTEEKVKDSGVVYLKRPPIKPKKESNSSDSKSSENQQQPEKNSAKAYFTHISPDEILQKIREFGEIEAIPDDYKINHLPVGWSLYFFSKGERKEQLLEVTFDTQESGFGASVVSEIDVSLYPQFLDMESGKKIWVAGTIEEVNPDGTGTFFIKPEHFGFDGKPPEQQIDESQEKPD